jgi:hypothetical protein
MFDVCHTSTCVYMCMYMSSRLRARKWATHVYISDDLHDVDGPVPLVDGLELVFFPFLRMHGTMLIRILNMFVLMISFQKT